MSFIVRAQRDVKFTVVRVSALAIIATSAIGADALAADHRLSRQDSNFNCSSVRPGDTVTLESGDRGPLTIQNCRGAEGQAIRIRNDATGSGPVVIRRTSGSAGGFVFSCIDCVHVEIDGSAKWAGAPMGKTYGIKVTMTGGEGPSAFLRAGGMSSFLTIRNVEVDGAWPALANDGIGISVNDHKVKASAHPGMWREGVLIEHNYVHDIEGEGLYVGPNWVQGDLPLRNIEIRYNIVENTGWDGINLKCSLAGTNSIHHNIVRRAGSRNDNESGQHSGIALYEATGSIYSNWIEDAGQAGIFHYLNHLPSTKGAQTGEIFNNVILRPGRLRPDKGHGINTGNRAGSAVPLAKIYHNTVVGARANGIRVGDLAAGGFIRDNIIADAASRAIAAPNSVPQANNREGASSNMGFVNGSGYDFRLRHESPARNAGGEQYPATDYRGVPRPQDGAPDQGAFEFSNSGDNATQPKPPVLAVD